MEVEVYGEWIWRGGKMVWVLNQILPLASLATRLPASRVSRVSRVSGD